METELEATRRRLTELRAKLAASAPDAKDYYTRVVALWEQRVRALETAA
jgi:hypothetical protein